MAAACRGLRESDAVPGRCEPDAVVEGGDPGCDGAGDGRDTGDVGDRDGRDARTRFGERGEHRLHMGGGLVRVEPGPQQVVDPGDHRGDVGAESECGAELFRADLSGEPPPDGQVGVPDLGARRGEPFGEAVREAAQPGEVVAVTDSLSLAVAQCDVSHVLTVAHAPSVSPAAPACRTRRIILNKVCSHFDE